MAEKTSLEKSHSKSSNAKLTLLCVFTVIFFSLLWVFLALLKFEKIPSVVTYIGIAVSGVLTLLGLIGFNAFKR